MIRMWAVLGALVVGLLAALLFGFAVVRTKRRCLSRRRSDVERLLGVEAELTAFASGSAVRSMSKWSWLAVAGAIVALEVAIAAVNELLGSWAMLVWGVASVTAFAAMVLGAFPSARLVAFTGDARMHLMPCSPGWNPSHIAASVPVAADNLTRVNRWTRRVTIAGQRVRISTLDAFGEVPASE